ncbi:hypothetical protein LNL84_17010 [Vibrio sp. ZSDZ34]|uniref:Uncharacterized protein n=1 Tax=Vibrio gelatinilyticus TaxID=2893468 RepID=A0A9X1WEC4_9VIBR|nr:hypothetical protein [Vibrio gelatinilyticus]MCJ2378516.1 hypothetical protein [Vibrio gelatinilyticus]
MTMISAKQFAHWLKDRFSSQESGVVLTREDITHLSGRQTVALSYINDIHYELMQYNIAFVTDASRDKFFLIPIGGAEDWRATLEHQYERELYCNVFPMDKSG